MKNTVLNLIYTVCGYFMGGRYNPVNPAIDLFLYKVIENVTLGIWSISFDRLGDITVHMDNKYVSIWNANKYYGWLIYASENDLAQSSNLWERQRPSLLAKYKFYLFMRPYLKNQKIAEQKNKIKKTDELNRERHINNDRIKSLTQL